jgi:hypothetical protein
MIPRSTVMVNLSQFNLVNTSKMMSINDFVFSDDIFKNKTVNKYKNIDTRLPIQ